MEECLNSALSNALKHKHGTNNGPHMYIWVELDDVM